MAADDTGAPVAGGAGKGDAPAPLRGLEAAPSPAASDHAPVATGASEEGGSGAVEEGQDVDATVEEEEEEEEGDGEDEDKEDAPSHLPFAPGKDEGVAAVSTTAVLSAKSPTATSPTQGQFRGRPELTDQREKYLQRLQQVQQQQGNLLNASHATGINQKQFSTQQPNSLLQQFNSQNPSISSQVGLGLGVQGPGISSAFSAQLQRHESQILEQYAGHTKSDEQQGLAEDANVESTSETGSNKHTNEYDTKAQYSNPPASVAEGTQLSRDSDLSPGQPLQPCMPSSGVGVIGRRSVSDFGVIGDNLSGTSGTSGHDHYYNLQMLEAACHRLPQPKDSERAKTYILASGNVKRTIPKAQAMTAYSKYIVLLILLMVLLVLPSAESRVVGRIASPSLCNVKILAKQIISVCLTDQPTPMCCEFLILAIDKGECICDVMKYGVMVDTILIHYRACGGVKPDIVGTIKNCSNVDILSLSTPAPQVGVAATLNKSNHYSLWWVLVIAVAAVFLGLLICLAIKLKKKKEGGRIAHTSPESEMTNCRFKSPRKRQNADESICVQHLDVPIRDDLPFVMTRGRAASLKEIEERTSKEGDGRG